jgi:hypothetical protein
MAPVISPISPMFAASRYIRYFDVLKMVRSFLTAATIEVKLSSVSVISAASLAEIRAGDAHRDADVGL